MAVPTNFDSFPRFSIDSELAVQLEQLGMEKNVHQLREEGYTVIRDPAPLEFTQRLREVVLRLVEETEGASKGLAAPLLLGRDPIFDEVLLNPKLTALAEMTLGKGAIISQLNSSVRPRTRRGYRVGLHADQNWFPVPFAEHMQTITCCWACDDFSEFTGGTMVIPRSHFERRPPTREEAEKLEGAIPIECPAGSLAVWSGETWHGSYPRQAEGKRVTVHITMGRNYLRQIESYDHLPDAYFDGKPDALRVIAGRADFFGSSTVERGGVDMELFGDSVRRQNPTHPEFRTAEREYDLWLQIGYSIWHLFQIPVVLVLLLRLYDMLLLLQT